MAKADCNDGWDVAEDMGQVMNYFDHKLTVLSHETFGLLRSLLRCLLRLTHEAAA